MNAPLKFAGGLFLATVCSAPLAQAVNVAGAAYGGSAILGVNDTAVFTDFGIARVNQGIPALVRINDNSLTTIVDNFWTDGQGNSSGLSFTGIRWPFTRADSVKTLTLTMAVYGDGGWFGLNGQAPAPGQPLPAAMLVEPVVQVTTDGGVTWSTRASTSDYLTKFTNFLIGGGGQPNPRTQNFVITLTTPVSAINGVRIIGQSGGLAGGDTNGFIGVAELVVDTGAVVDTDSDGIEDSWESSHGLTVGVNEAASDPDADSLTNINEFLANTNPQNADTDGDGFRDGLEVALLTNPSSASSRPANISRAGTGIIGVNDDIDADAGTPVIHVGTAANIVDGNLTTRVDTYNGTGGVNSFVGVMWPAVWPQAVSRLELTLATFFDGGWFGPNSTGPGNGGALDASFLIQPKIQITTDGTTWTTVDDAAVSGDYVAQMTGHLVGNTAVLNPTSRKFVLELIPPLSNVRGIRLIGPEGGAASQGFLGVFDLTIQDVTSAQDIDADGLTITQEAALGTNPNDSDSDDDGLNDGAEVNLYQTNPLVVDTDGDGFSDGSEVSLGTDPKAALSRIANIARGGTGIAGINDAIDGDSGTVALNAGTAANINDGNALTRVDTYNNAADTNSFVGIVWPTVWPQPVSRVEYTLATFFDGGWFGFNAIGPGNGGMLDETYLVQPTVQITTDGTTWTDVAPANVSSDYLTAMNGHLIGNTGGVNPTSRKTTFDFIPPIPGIRGIRLIGSEGGTASNGFLGIFEFSVQDTTTIGDIDGDGLQAAQEAALGTNPNDADSDDDGLDDGAEVNVHLTNPLLVDTDGDGFGDGAEKALSTDPLLATSRIANIARGGSPVTGVNDAIDADDGIAVANAGAAANANDGNPVTRVDTYRNTGEGFSYVGIKWPVVWPKPVSRIDFTLATFFDGGWFGLNASDPGNGGTLDDTYLVEPTVQITTDGITWTDASAVTTVTSNYMVQMNGHAIGNTAGINPTSRQTIFEFLPPLTGIKGIRLIGSEGGTASGGFLGIFEFMVQDITTAGDPDDDGLTNTEEAAAGTNPNDPDSDDDGLKDGAEVKTWLSNPLATDTDGDLFSDGAEALNGGNPTSKLAFPPNFAVLGTGLFGLNDVVDGDPGTDYVHAGVAASLVDGNPATRVDTYNGAGTETASFAGVSWSGPQTVKTVTINFATFTDGGWFGVNGTDPGAGGTLSPAFLVEPEVQVTTDGVTWTTAAHTSDYLTALNGHGIGGGANPNPSSRSATFTLVTAAYGVTGVRVIGTDGGVASAGFLGAFEFEATSGGTGNDKDADGLPDDWEVTNFGYIHAQHGAGDIDLDGLSTFLEYAFSTNPMVPNAPVQFTTVEGGYLTATLTKKAGITFTVETGAGPEAMGTADTTVLINDVTTLKVRDNFLSNAAQKRFMRVRATPGR